MKLKLILIIIILTLISCADEHSKQVKTGGYTDGVSTLFTKVGSEQSNITFMNNIREDLEFNFIVYPYIYGGGGVAVGDIDNDGLQDIYLVSNLEPNILYKNKGDFVFEDISVSSRTEGLSGFCTGATMLDINNDGWMDIYVSRAGSLNDDDGRRNLLYVNQQDGTFKEEAMKWGIDDPGYTTQAYTIDYDKDGDLDLYIVNYRYDFRNNTRISGALQRQIEEVTSDQLYRNDGNRFTKVTGPSGIYNKAWGLSASIGDFNNDGWDDIYVANDYLEPDILYINQQDGTFKDEANMRMNHISFNSMGSDYADLNNDLFPDLITVDMLAENYARSKENMASMSTENFMTLVDIGYHHAYMANMLHYNVGNGKFQETAQLSGVVKTDWSWAPLLADFNNDGLKDVFISNGIYKDYHNQDFRNALKEKNAQGVQMTIQQVSDMIPQQKLNNYIYRNNGDMTFGNMIEEWGLEDPGFSNGAAYADFDNDGDLDIIVNNINDQIGLYENHANNNYIQIHLNGPPSNSLGIGAKVYVKSENKTQLQKLYLTRGYQSSVPEFMNFGLGGETKVKTIIVQWPDGKLSRKKNVKANQNITIDYSKSENGSIEMKEYTNNKEIIIPSHLGIDYTHKENDFNDYSLQLLLPQKQSTKGTGIVKADVNEDGLEDFFVGNASGAEAALYKQNSNGTFTATNRELWMQEAKYEDANALFLDSDGDGDQDLYVVSAGYELEENDPLLQDRLYINDGNGNFSYAENALPAMLTSGKSVVAGDYDGDGDLDLFIGGNLIPKKYPLPPRSFLLKNENGTFVDDTSSSNSLAKIGMISEAVFTDYDMDNDLDLMMVGEWMAPTLFTNHGGTFEKNENITGLEKTSGWWFSITADDFDGDGDDDFVMGNIGKNNKFHPSIEKPLYIFAKDFDNNGSFDVAMSKINNGKLVPVRGKECSSEQNPFLLTKIQTYNEFAHMEFKDIYGEDRLKDAFTLTSYFFESIYVENKGNGNFEITKLPVESQLGPTLSTITGDFNQDGNLDVIGVGAIYDAEVETIRYDSNYGYVLIGDGDGNFEYSKQYDPFIDSDSKDLLKIKIGSKEHYMVVCNNAPIQIFTFSP